MYNRAVETIGFPEATDQTTTRRTRRLWAVAALFGATVVAGSILGCGSSDDTGSSGSASGTTSGAASGAASGMGSGSKSGMPSGSMSGATSGAASGRPTDAGTDADATTMGGDADAASGPAPGDLGGQCLEGGLCNGSNVCGEAGVCAAYCDSQPKKALPYSIGPDYPFIAISGPGAANYTLVSNPDCNATTFPPVAPKSAPTDAASDAEASADGGDDGSADAGTDGAAEAASDAAADSPADAGADSPADGGTADAGEAEAGPAPACFEFLFNPSSSDVGTGYGVAEFHNTAQGKANPGVCIASGAVGVAFWARASRDGTIVKFGSTEANQCITDPMGNSVHVVPNDVSAQQAICPGKFEFHLSIGTTWQQYIVSIPAGADYDNVPGTLGGVVKGFTAVVEPPDYWDLDAGASIPTYILVKDIRWVNTWAGAGDAGSDATTSDSPSDAPASQ